MKLFQRRLEGQARWVQPVVVEPAPSFLPVALILTNWHVAYDAVRQASLQGSHDYVRDGFVAKSLKEELKGPNYEVWITKSCKDVSKEVTDVIGSEQDPLKRANRVRDVMQEIAQAAQEDKSSGEADGGKRCDVQEMLPNESYVLFTYETRYSFGTFYLFAFINYWV